jgi:hypothetical protein
MPASPQVRPIVSTVLPFFLTFSLFGYLGRRLIPQLDQVRPVDTWEGANRVLAFVMMPVTMSTPLEVALLVVGLTLILVDYLRRELIRAKSPADRLELTKTAAFAGWAVFAMAAILVTAFANHAIEEKALVFAAI